MSQEFIKAEDLYGKYSDAKTFMLPLHEPLDEFERIARNKPHPGIAKNLPKVTDGTLAALIQEQPKRIVQQIPTAKVNSDSDWMNILGGWVLEHEIIPNANQVAALIQKSWSMISKALTYGSQPAFVQFVNRGDYIGTDFTLPYIKDVLLEPGKLSDRDSNVIFLRSWWTKGQIEGIIKREKMLKDKSKARKDEQPYESGWDIPKLKKLIDKPGQKPQTSMSPNEREKQLNTGFVEIVHCFQRGIGNTFYSFAPSLGESDNIVRTKVNPDPRGYIPIHFMYMNIDMSNPLGRGSVELSGGMQNLLDSEVQSYQYMRALMMNPPVEKRGNFSKSTIVYEPQAIWDMGSDPNASVTPVKLETTSLSSFPNNYGLVKSQILNLNSSTDTSVGAEAGNPGFSKTPAGVRTQEQRLGVSDNYMRKQFESAFEEIMETCINLYFAERNGVEVFQLDDETAQKLKKVAPDAVNEKNEVQIDFDQETERLDVQVDASTSSLNDDSIERDRLVELLDLSQKYPALAQMMGEDGTRELINRIVVKTGVEDPEKIMPTPEDQQMDPETGMPMQQQQQQQPQMGPEEIQAMVGQMLEQHMEQMKQADPKNNPVVQMMDALKIKFTDLPQDAQHQVLQQIGLPSNEATPTHQELAIKKMNTAVNAQSNMVKDSKVMEPEDMKEPGEKPEGTPADTKEDISEGENPYNEQPEAEDQGEMEQPENSAPDMQEDMSEGEGQDQGLSEDDKLLVSELTKRGYDNKQIAKAILMMRDGMPNEEIVKVLNGVE